jgi:hypothetical protein
MDFKAFLEPKKLTPLLTTAVLGAVYLYLQYKHAPVPPALSQAIIASAGSLFAGTALAGAIPQPKGGNNAAAAN